MLQTSKGWRGGNLAVNRVGSLWEAESKSVGRRTPKVVGTWRSKNIFDTKQALVVSEQFHNTVLIYIASEKVWGCNH